MIPTDRYSSVCWHIGANREELFSSSTGERVSLIGPWAREAATAEVYGIYCSLRFDGSNFPDSQSGPL